MLTRSRIRGKSFTRACSQGSHTPVDVAAIRWNIGLLLPHHQALPLTDDELAALTAFLRTHTQLLITHVEQAAAKRPPEDVPRYIALACTRQAHDRLSAPPAPDRHSLLVHARRLARALAALCDHHDALTDVAMSGVAGGAQAGVQGDPAGRPTAPTGPSGQPPTARCVLRPGCP
ncbi:DUF6415 family natural product biosynthesis protein [Streptomyces adustus]